MKKLLFLSIFFIELALTAQSSLYTREINIADDYELSKATELLMSDNKRIYDKETKAYRNKTSLELENEFLEAKQKVIQNQGKNQHIFVCVSSENGSIKGILYCKYGHRRQSDMVEILKVKVDKDQSWTASINFWSKDNSNDVMLSMIQYAENFYRKLSMKSIIKISFNKNESNYLDQGYRLITKEESNKILFLSEAMGDIVGAACGSVIIHVLTFGLCDAGQLFTKTVDNLCIYYKEL
ncbi:hypothetical protein HYV10_00065 [Candidatus Dependentiae bacterium]|nr:hypothetical protein [Candidatus Dependentiae bacterium]